VATRFKLRHLKDCVKGNFEFTIYDLRAPGEIVRAWFFDMPIDFEEEPLLL
jgi:hypothetical protein